MSVQTVNFTGLLSDGTVNELIVMPPSANVSNLGVGPGGVAASRAVSGYSMETVDGTFSGNVADGVARGGPINTVGPCNGPSLGNVAFTLECILLELRQMGAILLAMQRGACCGQDMDLSKT